LGSPFVSLKTAITLTPTMQLIAPYAVSEGRISLTIYDGADLSNCVGIIELAIFGGYCINVTNYGQFNNYDYNIALPENYFLQPQFPYDIYADYSGNQLWMSVGPSDSNAVLQIFSTWFSPAFYLGPNAQATDVISEYTSSSGTTFSSAVTMNGGAVNVGSSSLTTYTLNFGTDSGSGGRAVNVGNTVSGSVLTLNGDVETPNPSSGTVTFNNPTGGTWTNVASAARRVGKMCFVTIDATLNVTGLTLSGLISCATITPSGSFVPSSLVVGPCTVTNGGVPASAALTNTASTAAFSLYLPNVLAFGSTVTVVGSLSYVV